MRDDIRENLEFLHQHAKAVLLKKLVETLLEDESVEPASVLRTLLEQEPPDSAEGK